MKVVWFLALIGLRERRLRQEFLGTDSGVGVSLDDPELSSEEDNTDASSLPSSFAQRASLQEHASGDSSSTDEEDHTEPISHENASNGNTTSNAEASSPLDTTNTNDLIRNTEDHTDTDSTIDENVQSLKEFGDVPDLIHVQNEQDISNPHEKVPDDQRSKSSKEVITEDLADDSTNVLDEEMSVKEVLQDAALGKEVERSTKGDVPKLEAIEELETTDLEKSTELKTPEVEEVVPEAIPKGPIDVLNEKKGNKQNFDICQNDNCQILIFRSI